MTSPEIIIVIKETLLAFSFQLMPRLQITRIYIYLTSVSEFVIKFILSRNIAKVKESRKRLSLSHQTNNYN